MISITPQNPAAGDTVRIAFSTAGTDGDRVDPSDAFEAADFAIYKNGSTTEKTTTNGITITSTFDSRTGQHLLEIDTSNNTGDAGFWADGADYMVLLYPDETVDSQTVGTWIGGFSLRDGMVISGTKQTLDDLNDVSAADLETAMVNAGDGTDLLTAIADKLASDWTVGDLSTQAIISAIKADVTLAQMIARIDAAMTTRAAAGDQMDLVDAPNATAVEVLQSGLATEAKQDPLLSRVIDGTATLLTNLIAMISGSGGTAAFTETAMENAPSGGGGGVEYTPSYAMRVQRPEGSIIEFYVGEHGYDYTFDVPDHAIAGTPKFTFTDKNGDSLADVAATRSGDSFTHVVNSAVTTAATTSHTWNLWDVVDGVSDRLVAKGQVKVFAARKPA